jgi:RNA polymerase sigma-70 factor (ECF subfamily)
MRSDERSEDIDIGTLYERHGSRVRAHCLRRLGDEHEAADAVQDTFLRAWLALRGGADVRYPLAWLLTIAENVCVSTFRAKRARVATEPLWEGGGELPSEEDVGSIGAVPTLTDAVLALPPRQRVALVRRELEGYSYDEIAEELGVSRASVAALLHRARGTLMHSLREVRRGLAAVFPIPSVLYSPFQGGAATAALGTAVVSIGVAQIATPGGAASPPRSSSATSIVQVAGEPAAVRSTADLSPRGLGSRAALGSLQHLDIRRSAIGRGRTAVDQTRVVPPATPPLGAPRPDPEQPGPSADEPTTHETPGPGLAPDQGPAETGPTLDPVQAVGSSGGSTSPGRQPKGERGHSASAPGQNRSPSSSAPGNSASAPGQTGNPSDGAQGNSANAPGQNGNPSEGAQGNSANAPDQNGNPSEGAQGNSANVPGQTSGLQNGSKDNASGGGTPPGQADGATGPQGQNGGTESYEPSGGGAAKGPSSGSKP